MAKSLKMLGLMVLFSVVGLLSYAWQMGSRYIAPERTAIGRPPADLGIKNIELADRSAWFLPASPSRACVLLLHGVRSNRRSMLKRARFLVHHGYSSLLIDLQAHGESPGDYISYGHLESDDVRHAIAFLQQHKLCAKVAILGRSLGGAAAILAQPPLAVDAMIVEASFGSIEEAISNRLVKRYGALGAWFTPLLAYQIPLRLNIDLQRLDPSEAIKHVTVPILILAGDKDRRTLLHETKRLYKNAAGEKRLWVVRGARHQDLHQYAKILYEKRILGFLAEFME